MAYPVLHIYKFLKTKVVKKTKRMCNKKIQQIEEAHDHAFSTSYHLNCFTCVKTCFLDINKSANIQKKKINFSRNARAQRQNRHRAKSFRVWSKNGNASTMFVSPS